jgi:hypothetical protein
MYVYYSPKPYPKIATPSAKPINAHAPFTMLALVPPFFPLGVAVAVPVPVAVAVAVFTAVVCTAANFVYAGSQDDNADANSSCASFALTSGLPGCVVFVWTAVRL